MSTYKYLYWAVFVAYGLIYIQNWPSLRSAGIKGDNDFGDLQIVLTASDCFRFSGSDIYKLTEGTCSYNYGESLLIFLNLLGIRGDATSFVGIFLVVFTIFCFLELLRVLQPKPTVLLQVIAFISFTSPPIQLLFERGNIDALIFDLLCLALIAFSRRWQTTSLFLLSAAATFKFYSLPSLSAIGLFLDRTRGQFLRYIFVVVVSAVFIAGDLIKVLGGFSIPNPWGVAFGSSIFGHFLDDYSRLDFTRFQLTIIGLAVVSACLLFVLFIEKTTLVLDSIRDEIIKLSLLETSTLWVFGTTVLGCYLLTMNYDYRLIFLIPMVCLLAMLDSWIALLPLISGVMSLWGSYNFDGIGQLIVGDIPLLGFCVFLCWSLAKQFLRFRLFSPWI